MFTRFALRSFKVNTRSCTTNNISQNGNKWKILLASAAVLGGAYLYTNTYQGSADDKKKDEKKNENDKKVALDPKEFRDFKLESRTKVAHNTDIYRFSLQSSEHQLDLPVASFVLVQADIKGEEKPVVRPYTPITYDEKGHFDLLIKHYPDGKLTPYLKSLKEGDSISVKGPIKKLAITPNMKKSIGMIAGGSGLTPMLQVAHELLKNSKDNTQLTLIFANVSEEDILLRDRLEKMQKEHKNFKVHYVLEKPPKNWKGDTGYVTEDVAKKLLPPPSDDTLILVCGPGPMMKAISGTKNEKFEQGELSGVLKKLGYNEKQVFKF